MAKCHTYILKVTVVVICSWLLIFQCNTDLLIFNRSFWWKLFSSYFCPAQLRTLYSNRPAHRALPECPYGQSAMVGTCRCPTNAVVGVQWQTQVGILLPGTQARGCAMPCTPARRSWIEHVGGMAIDIRQIIHNANSIPVMTVSKTTDWKPAKMIINYSDKAVLLSVTSRILVHKEQ